MPGRESQCGIEARFQGAIREKKNYLFSGLDKAISLDVRLKQREEEKIQWWPLIRISGSLFRLDWQAR